MSLTKDPKGLRSFRNPAGLQVNTKTQTGFFYTGQYRRLKITIYVCFKPGVLPRRKKDGTKNAVQAGD